MPWYGSEGSGHILQFDSNGKPVGCKKEIQVRKPSERIAPSGPYLLLSEDNNVCHRVDTRPKIPTFTLVQTPPLPPPTIINLASPDHHLRYNYTPSSRHYNLLHHHQPNLQSKQQLSPSINPQKLPTIHQSNSNNQ